MKKIFSNQLKILALAAYFFTTPGWALELNGNKKANGTTYSHGTSQWQTQMQTEGLVALYLFNETTGPFLDSSGYRNPQTNALEPLNLIIDNPDAGAPGPGIQEVVRTG
ncbi:MAG: hypothetical protein KDD34_01075, partial [Bdellovibrionales bacterium]|nr:hypothetical protein [Bdellovibrionales bacterium]